MYNTNNNGPNVEPLGTPQFIFFISEEYPEHETYCFLLQRNEWNQSLVNPLIP